MDIHLVGKVSVEETTQAHLKDLAVQEKYGVTYHQYWYNEEAGTIYCLMEAPDKASCEATHREANNVTACQIVEVEGGMYDLFMGKEHRLDHGLVLNEKDFTDPGNRSILTLNFISDTSEAAFIGFEELRLPKDPKESALALIEEFKGKHVGALGYDCIIAVFQKPVEVIECALGIQLKLKEIQARRNKFSFTMGISTGQPLTEHEGFFTKAIELSHRLCLAGGDSEIITSASLKESCPKNKSLREENGIRTLKPSDQIFLNRFLDITENHLADQEFGIEYLSRELYTSRPQLYRKIFSITNRSPVRFIRDIRLTKALSLIREDQYNLSQIALEVGYNSPSYFSKCFQEKFGIKPSRVSV